MKIKFRVLKRTAPADYYNFEARTDFIIQKKGWFGWKSLVEVYDGYSKHYAWSYFRKPSICDNYAAFRSKKQCLSFLRMYYNKNKIKEEIV